MSDRTRLDIGTDRTRRRFSFAVALDRRSAVVSEHNPVGDDVVDRVVVHQADMPVDIEAIGCIIAAYLGERELRPNPYGGHRDGVPTPARRTAGTANTGSTRDAVVDR